MSKKLVEPLWEVKGFRGVKLFEIQRVGAFYYLLTFEDAKGQKWTELVRLEI